MIGPLLTRATHEQLANARRQGALSLSCSLDLQRSTTTVGVAPEHWTWNAQPFPYLDKCKERTIYYWDGADFLPLARYTSSLIKLVPTQWGPPTFEIDGIKMLPTQQVSPYADAQRKVALIQAQGKRILDTCGGLGYFAAWCLQDKALEVCSFEKNPSVIWLRSHNPWSPPVGQGLRLSEGDITEQIVHLASASFDAALHDPPRFGIAGELYSLDFYAQLARVLKPRGKLFHYTGSPNRLTSGRDVPEEVTKRLRRAGFTTELVGDGILAVRN